MARTDYDAVAELYRLAVRNASSYDPYVLGLRAALCAIAEQRYEVQPATLAGRNVVDRWTGEVIDHRPTIHRAAALATQLNRNSGATCIDELATEVAA